MKLPVIEGVIDRRILINYQAEEEVLNRFLPEGLRPKLVKGKGIVGICLIRLKNIRPKAFPKAMGISSENGAHRIAVEWHEAGALKEGVYIPRRDTSSRINALVGGRIFPGKHYYAKFQQKEIGQRYNVSFQSEDGTYLSIKACESKSWEKESVFEDMSCASSFMEKGSVGYSPLIEKGKFEGLELKTKNWAVSGLKVEAVKSSFFEDESIFPRGSIKFDNALLMKNIEHEWIKLKDKPRFH
ncbi:MAG: DUF2071 domain-containing protein [Bacteroidota bacterium]